MESNDKIKCPFCESEINEFTERQRQILFDEVNASIIPALMHDLKWILNGLYFSYQEREKEINQDQDSLSHLDSDKRHLNNLRRFLDSLHALYRMKDYKQEMVDFEMLGDRIEWLCGVFHSYNVVKYYPILFSDRKINIDDYWILFLYAFHSLNKSISKVRYPNVSIEFKLEKNFLITEIIINQDKEKFEINDNWRFFKNLCLSLGSEVSISTDDSSAIVQWSISIS